MRIRLVKRLANAINGIDLTDYRVGDVLDLPTSRGLMLIAEGWAEQVPDAKAKPLLATTRPQAAH